MTPEERRLIVGWIKEQIANQEKALEEAKKASHK
uniref:Cytochrome c n=1 Tax=Siphoviridae sp. ctrgt10 TaxID=2826479 RepID=A0A8S5M7G8_9CAUD|nr:MAG TPA: Cytochrome c [Siphoviridae sp. ctrgt10]